MGDTIGSSSSRSSSSSYLVLLHACDHPLSPFLVVADGLLGVGALLVAHMKLHRECRDLLGEAAILRSQQL